MIQYNNPKILILDDEDIVRILIESYLQDNSMEVFSCADGMEALSIMSKVHIDVAIVDMKMPLMSGEEFIINAKKISPSTRYIIHSGSFEIKIPKSLVDLGITSEYVLQKPVDLHLFLKKIEFVLSNR